MTPCESILIDDTENRRIVEIVFQGGEWSTDTSIKTAISDAVAEHQADAVLLNLLDFRYHGGDYASGFLIAFYDMERRVKRPACFLGADHGMRTLFNAVDATGTLGVRYFDERNEAVKYLRSRLRPEGGTR